MEMTQEQVERFAAEWADAWNRRDVDTVLGYFHADSIFISPTVLAITGNARVHGKAALCEYWLAALSRVNSLKFSVQHVLWDAVRLELAIIYISEIDGQCKRVSENLRFNHAGQVIAGEVFHGIPVTK